jgi:hypothetical protein
MTRDLDVLATTRALLQGGIDPEPILQRDPNTRRLLEALCIRHNIPAVYRTQEPIHHDD